MSKPEVNALGFFINESYYKQFHSKEMKIAFTVTKLYHHLNEKSKEQFVKLELVKSINKTEKGCIKNQKLVVHYNVLNTSLKVGDIFTFDSENYTIVEKKYIDKNGLNRISRNIYNKAMDIEKLNDSIM